MSSHTSLLIISPRVFKCSNHESSSAMVISLKSIFFFNDNDTPVSSSRVSSSTTLPVKSVNSSGCKVLKYIFKLYPLWFNTLVTASITNLWKGLITTLSNKIDADFNSSALLPNPVPSLIPNNKGDTTRCDIITFCIDSELRNWYWLWASLNCTGVMSAAESLPSFQLIIKRPAFDDPPNFDLICASTVSLTSAGGCPLLKFINIEGARPFMMLLMWKLEISDSKFAYCVPPW